MRTPRRVIATGVLLALLAGALGCGGGPSVARPTSGTTVIAFGDSLVEGRGSTDGRDFVSMLARRLGVPIINAGRSGDTTGAALARLDRDVLSRSPRVVIVVLGGNDYLRRIPVNETFSNLSSIVTKIRDRGAAVVLAGVSVGLLTDPYGSRYEALARETSSGLVPDILGGLMGRSDRMADAIHPNNAGYEIIADRIAPVLEELLDD